MNAIAGNKVFRHPLLTINHIIDPLIENGLHPRSLVEEGSGYISFQYGTAGCIGSIVLGLDLESRFPRRYSDGLMEWLCDVFDCDINFLEGVENGFDGGFITPSHLINRQYKDGRELGLKAMRAYQNPTLENFQGYMA